jgi:hypothetical protein
VWIFEIYKIIDPFIFYIPIFYTINEWLSEVEKVAKEEKVSEVEKVVSEGEKGKKVSEVEKC